MKADEGFVKGFALVVLFFMIVVLVFGLVPNTQ